MAAPPPQTPRTRASGAADNPQLEDLQLGAMTGSEAPESRLAATNPLQKRTRFVEQNQPSLPLDLGAGKTTSKQMEERTRKIRETFAEVNRLNDSREQLCLEVMGLITSLDQRWDADTTKNKEAKAMSKEWLKAFEMVAVSFATGGIPTDLDERLKRKTTSARTAPTIQPTLPRRAATATPKQPTYANVARGAVPTTGAGAKNKPRQHVVPTAKREDDRVLLPMMDPDSVPLSQFAIRQELLAIFQLAPTDITGVSRTAKGYAVHTASKDIRDRLLDKEKTLLLQQKLKVMGARLVEQWLNYALPAVPSALNTLGGQKIPVTKEAVWDEVLLKTRQVPKEVKQARAGADPATGRCTWIVSFMEPVRPFRLFDESDWSSLCKARNKIDLHNPGCQGYCNPRRCTRLPRCNNCSELRENHPHGECTAISKCANCHGPHPAGMPGCPAVPEVQAGKVVMKSQSRLKKIRRLGRLAWEETNSPTNAEVLDTQINEESLMHEDTEGQPATQKRTLEGDSEDSITVNRNSKSTQSLQAGTPALRGRATQPLIVTAASSRSQRSQPPATYNEGVIVQNKFGALAGDDDSEPTTEMQL